jgi:hypothetical protein
MSAPETAPVPRFTFKKKLQFEARCRAQLTVSSVLPEVPSNGVVSWSRIYLVYEAAALLCICAVR